MHHCVHGSLSKGSKLAINFQGVIYTHSMGVLLLWQKHLCSELIDSPMRLEMFSLHLCSGRHSTGVCGSGVIHAGENKSCNPLKNSSKYFTVFALLLCINHQTLLNFLTMSKSLIATTVGKPTGNYGGFLKVAPVVWLLHYVCN